MSMSQEKRSEWVSPRGKEGCGGQAELSGRSEAWVDSGRLRPSSWDDSDEEPYPKARNPQSFRIYSGGCKRSPESVLEEINEIKNEFFRNLVKEEEASSPNPSWTDRRQSPARIRRRTKSSSSSSPVFEHQPETLEEIDPKNSKPEADEPEMPEFELDAKFFLNDFYANLRSKRISLPVLGTEWHLEEPGSADKSSETSKPSEEEEECQFSRTSRKLSQILEVEEARRESEELSERGERENEEEGEEEGEERCLLSGGRASSLGPPESPSEKAGGGGGGGGGQARSDLRTSLATADFSNLVGKHGPFGSGVRDEVIFLTAKCGKTEIGLTKETGWLDDKAFQLPTPNSPGFNEILRIDLENPSPRKEAGNLIRTKSPKFNLNLESLGSEKVKDVTEREREEESKKKSSRTDNTEKSSPGKSSHRSFHIALDEKSSQRSGRGQEERECGYSSSEKSWRRLEDGKGNAGSARGAGQSEGARSTWSKSVERKASTDRGAESGKSPEGMRRCREVKSAELTRGRSKSEGQRNFEKMTSTGTSSSSSNDSFANAEFPESGRSLKKEIGKIPQAPPSRSGQKKCKYVENKEECDGSSYEKTCKAARDKRTSEKAGDSLNLSPGKAVQTEERGDPEGTCSRKKSTEAKVNSSEKTSPKGTDESSTCNTGKECNSKREAQEKRKLSNDSVDRKSNARSSGRELWKDLIDTFHGNQDFPLGPEGSFPGFLLLNEDSDEEKVAAEESPPMSRRTAEVERKSRAKSREDGHLSSSRRPGKKMSDEKHHPREGEGPPTEKMTHGSEGGAHRNPQSLYYFDVGMSKIGEFGDFVPWNAGDDKSIQPATPKAHGDGNPAESAWEELPVKRQRPKKGKELRVHRQLWTESRDDLSGGSATSLSASLKLSKSSTCVSEKEKVGGTTVARSRSDCLRKRKGERGSEVRPAPKAEEEEETSGSGEENGSEEVEERGQMWQSFVNSKAFFEKTTKAGEKESSESQTSSSGQKAEEGKAGQRGSWLVVRDSGWRQRRKRKWQVPSRGSSRGSDGEFLFGRGLRSSVTPLKFRNSSCLRNFYKRLVGVFCLTSDSSVDSSK